MAQIVQLSNLTEKEEEAILSVIEKDLKLQNEEEIRIQYVNHPVNVQAVAPVRHNLYFCRELRDDIADHLLPVNHRTDDTSKCCAHCGVQFDTLIDSGLMCPTCSQWICKRDRIYSSYTATHQWICKLCDVRK